jgi:hypothetical protein
MLIFSMENANKELAAMNSKAPKAVTKSYPEGCPVEGVQYSRLAKQYIRSKRDKYFAAHVEFAKE